MTIKDLGYLVVIVSVLLIWAYFLMNIEEIFGAEIDEYCLTQENHSNFTENIWNKYCVDPQTDADYNGTGLQ